MAEVASAYVTLIPSARGFAKGIQSQVGGDLGKAGAAGGKQYAAGMGGSIRAGLGGIVKGVGLVLAGAGVVSFLKSANDEARESQKVGALTASVIKATGGAAKVTSQQVGDLAGALSAKTGIDDEVIQSGENMLLTFKNIRNESGKGNDVFDQSTKTLIDLAAAMGTEPKQAAIQLGKALNDPVKGITALTRVGVTFTKGQQKQIKAMVKSGDTLGAQKVILKELNSEFGGAAEAQATAGDKAAVAFGNLKEAIGTAFLPLVDKAATLLTDKLIPAFEVFFNALTGQSEVNEFDGTLRKLNNAGVKVNEWVHIAADAVRNFITEFQNGTGAGGKFRDILEKVGSIVQRVGGFIREHADNIKALASALGGAFVAFKIITTAVKVYTAVQAALNFVLAANPIGIVVVALGAMVGALIYAYHHSETFRKIVDGAFKAIGEAASFMWNKVLKPTFKFVVEAFLRLAGTIVHAAADAFGWVPGIGPKLKSAAAKFDEFRDSVNAALDGTHSSKTITVQTPGAREANRQLADLLFKTQHLPKSVTIGVQNKLHNIPGRASGGPVRAGQPYIVGEHRPELFVPDRDGTIVPRVPNAASRADGIDYDRLAAAMSRVNLSVPVSSIDRAVVGRIA